MYRRERMAEPAQSALITEEDTAIDKPTVLFVDDEKSILSSLRRLFRTSPLNVVTALGGEEGLAAFEKNQIDLVISDMRMPNMDGATFLAKVAEQWPDTVRILLTGYADLESTISAVNKGKIYRYISKPWDENDLRITVEQALEKKALERERDQLLKLTKKQNDELRTFNDELEKKVDEKTQQVRDTFNDVILIFTQFIELREGTASAGHGKRVASLAREMAQKLGLDKKLTVDIYLAGLLHDIGKVGLSDDIVKRDYTELSNEERKQVEKHVTTGPGILMSLPLLENPANMIRSHHERFDGSGYPDGLVKDKIPVGARILAIANEYDNLLSGYLLGKAASPAEAAEYIKKYSGKYYDPEAVEVFCQIADANRVLEEKATDLKINIEFLQEDMVLARDLLTSEGVLLLSKGLRLTTKVIEKIVSFQKDHNEDFDIYIYQD